MEDRKETAERLKRHVTELSLNIGERNFEKRANLDRAASYVYKSFEQSGYRPRIQEFNVDPVPWITRARTDPDKIDLVTRSPYRNICATLAGASQETIVVGAHYDTVFGSPGADDNASGVAGVLELARLLRSTPLEKTIEFVAFANEEPPFFRTSAMGSDQYVADSFLKKRKIVFMISLEMIGYYSEKASSQKYPPFLRFFYPDHANFIAVVGNFFSRRYVQWMKKAFDEKSDLSAQPLVAPQFVRGVDLSDQLSFWKRKIPAIMLTDTAFYRNPHYHCPTDLPETLNFEKMSEVVKGVHSFLIAEDRSFS